MSSPPATRSQDPTQKLAAAAVEAGVGQSFLLEVTEGPDAGKGFRIDGTDPRALVGTSPSCTVRLTDPAVSRRHAALDVQGARLRVTDLSSSNGTRIGKNRVFDALAEAGDSIRLGVTTIRVRRCDDDAEVRWVQIPFCSAIPHALDSWLTIDNA